MEEHNEGQEEFIRQLGKGLSAKQIQDAQEMLKQIGESGLFNALAKQYATFYNTLKGEGLPDNVALAMTLAQIQLGRRG